jgi:hypothetical protein
MIRVGSDIDSSKIAVISQGLAAASWRALR